MSRGPGALQRRILHELAQEPTGYLPWRWLRQRFPDQVRDKSFYRAVRSLRRMDRIIDYEVDRPPGMGGHSRYIASYPSTRQAVAFTSLTKPTASLRPSQRRRSAS